MKPEFRNPDRSAIVVANFLGVHDEDRALKPAAGGRGGALTTRRRCHKDQKPPSVPLACACQLAAAMQSQASLLA